ncbi:MAG: lysine--tRNA ligase [Archangium sp.]|nr:lysine--tRNA ligase [Archangium sp.]
MSDAEQKLLDDRKNKAKALQDLGVNPYGNGFKPDSLAGELVKQYADVAAEKLEADKPGPFTLGGRIVRVGDFGKAAFVTIQDRSGTIQAHLKKDVLGEEVWKIWKFTDLADFIGVKGTLFKSKTGELTIAATELKFLGKALRGLPGKFAGDDVKVKLSPEQIATVKAAAEAVMAASNAAPQEQREKLRADALAAQKEKYKADASVLKALEPAVNKLWAESQALADTEERYRRRYVDLLSNAGVRDTFKKRSRLVKFIREFLDARDFLEVETPMMHSLVSGAAARPFKTHHNALDIPLFMRIAPELHLKRLVVGGFDRVYEINRNFRNEGISTRHNPEFTMLEFYQAYATYEDLMDLTEQMISEASKVVTGSTVVKYADKTIDFKSGWPRIPMTEAISSRVKELTARDFTDTEKLRVVASRKATHDKDTGLLDAIEKMNSGELIGTLFEQFVEGELVQPTFITQFPVETSPLARRNDANPAITDRFELFCVGREIANAFSELNDPVDQASRFQAQVDARGRGQQETMDYDHDYIRALEHGLPPTAGEGIGIDRLAMLLTDAPSIRDVILFPLLKPQQN